MEIVFVALVPAFLLLLGAALLVISQISGFMQFTYFSNRRRQANWMLSQVLDQIAMAQGQLYQRAQELEQLSRRLELTNQELSRLNSMKSKFLSMVVHDLRTPLTTIQGFSQILARGMDPRRREFVQHIQTATERMNSLMSDLTDLAVIEAGRLKMSMQPFDFCAMVRELLAGSALVAREKGVELSVAEMPESVWVVGDRLRLSQVLQNLVNNAVKFTPAGGKVWVRMRVEADRLLVQVRDTGPGIHPSERKAIFEKFYQSAHLKDEKVKRQGWGLGLSIASEVVGAHRGTIGVESPGLGKGATFYFKIPLTQPGLRPAVGAPMARAT